MSAKQRWPIRSWARLVDVPRARYPDQLVYWRAIALRAMMLFTSVSMVVFLPIMLPVWESAIDRIAGIGGAAVFAMAVFWLAGRGVAGMRLAAVLLMPFYLLGMLAAGLAGHGILDGAMYGCVTTVLVGGLLMGARGAAVSAVASSLIVGALGWISLTRWRQGTLLPVSEVYLRILTFTMVTTVLFAAVLIILWEGLHQNLLREAVANTGAEREATARAEALAEVDRLKTAFFHDVSHELRTPLMLALGASEELLEDAALSPQARQVLEVARRNQQRLARLVNTLLDFARIEADGAQPRYEPIDLATLTLGLCGEFQSTIDRAGLRFQVHAEPLSEPVYVDPEMWEKIVLNLISNAIKFTLSGEIEVSLRFEGGQVELTVRDTGCGVSPEDLPRLFQRFYRARVAAGAARSHEGAGIGLSLVRELARLQGGAVRVQSVLGEGTTFTVSLPRGSAHLPAGPAAAARPSVPGARQGVLREPLGWLPGPEAPPAGPAGAERILVVDDNADMRQYLMRLLSRRWRVEAAQDVAAALARIQAEVPDLVLSDVMMPDTDGLALLQSLRREPRTATVPMILLSAQASEDSQVAGLLSGSDDYLVKPFSARELMARVSAHLEAARVRRQAAAAKLEFTRTIAHELASPLTAVYGYAQMLRELLHLRAAPEASSAEKMLRPIRRMQGLLRDLGDIVRIDADRFVIQPRPCDLAELCRQAAQEQEVASGRAISISLPEGAVQVEVDPGRIVQVLTNLLHNACKYSPPGAQVALALALQGPEAIVSLSDQGPGIPAEHHERLFQRFYRVPGVQELGGPAGGIGLGLYISKELIVRHGGRIWLASTVGQGSTFWIAVRTAAAGAGASEASPVGPVGPV